MKSKIGNKGEKYLSPIPLPHDVNSATSISSSELRIDPEGIHTLSDISQRAYLFSSRALLSLLEHKHGLSTHLKSLKRFFLLEHGDFFTQFMDIGTRTFKYFVIVHTLVYIFQIIQRTMS